ncbi:hypothetical protein [Vibrio aestuarianus]|uniref:hypothetical protein n=1 Tax=Vibrio aestuarianus TaxID=28171 RepID=UPI00237C9393|nr:hypothetical protein [Vibrio aestuarianus]MDE1238728.1 autophagy-related protein 13 [Vibrio aestuarianus]
MIKKVLLSLPALIIFSNSVMASDSNQLLQACPTQIVYSYSLADRYTAYSTDQFDFSSVDTLVLSVTYRNDSPNTLELDSQPQVWTHQDNDQNELHWPSSNFTYEPPVVNPGQEFTVKGVVNMNTVVINDNIVTIRPQVHGGMWFGDVETYAPVVGYEFICL